MKIDAVYVSTFKRDLYFTKICIASIRYWNNEIPVILLKDLSQGNFNTTELESHFNISVASLGIKNPKAYSKLYPFFAAHGKRVFIMDADIVWIGDLIKELEKFDEDLIIDGYTPKNYKEEAAKWYFNISVLQDIDPNYKYPGFFFNSGQFVVNTSSISPIDFKNIIEWKEDIKPIHEKVFLCEDQGILNYIVAKKLERNELTVNLHNFLIWGWDKQIKKTNLEKIKNKIETPFLIHWFGLKSGIISFLPGYRILKFYEDYYFDQLNVSRLKKYITRIKRTIKHLDIFSYEFTKKVIYIVLKKN